MDLAALTPEGFQRAYAAHWQDWSAKRPVIRGRAEIAAGSLTDEDNLIHEQFIAEAQRRSGAI